MIGLGAQNTIENLIKKKKIKLSVDMKIKTDPIDFLNTRSQSFLLCILF